MVRCVGGTSNFPSMSRLCVCRVRGELQMCPGIEYRGRVGWGGVRVCHGRKACGWV